MVVISIYLHYNSVLWSFYFPKSDWTDRFNWKISMTFMKRSRPWTCTFYFIAQWRLGQWLVATSSYVPCLHPDWNRLAVSFKSESFSIYSNDCPRFRGEGQSIPLKQVAWVKCRFPFTPAHTKYMCGFNCRIILITSQIRRVLLEHGREIFYINLRIFGWMSRYER